MKIKIKIKEDKKKSESETILYEVFPDDHYCYMGTYTRARVWAILFIRRIPKKV